MTYAHLKATLNARLLGESKYKGEDSFIKVLLHDALNQIAQECVPLVLLTSDFVNEKVVRQVDEKYYIRAPRLPESENDEIDIDNSLELAVVYLICSYIARNPNQPYAAMAKAIIDSQRWVAFEYLQKMEIVDELHRRV